MTEKELDNWYSQQPFDNVERITGVRIWIHPEADDAKDGEKTRDEALDEAKDVWDGMTEEDKQYWFDEI